MGRLWAKFTKRCKREPQADQSSQAKDLFPSRRVDKSSSAASWSHHEKTDFWFFYLNLKRCCPVGIGSLDVWRNWEKCKKYKNSDFCSLVCVVYSYFFCLTVSSKLWQFCCDVEQVLQQGSQRPLKYKSLVLWECFFELYFLNWAVVTLTHNLS